MKREQTSELPDHEIYALRYATRAAKRSDNFMGGDPHDGPMPMDYFVWYIKSPTGIVVVDTGFSKDMAKKRGRDFIASPGEVLLKAGVDPAEVKNVVLTHLHYDHAGNLDQFPKAQFHIQDDEVAYATGRHMTQPQLRGPFEVEDVVSLVRLVYRERVSFYKGDAELSPGITLHRIGGHSMGLQCVRVSTARGWVVLAADSTHYYENYLERKVFPQVYNIGDTLDGYRTILELAASPDHVVPGHDPMVMTLYSAPSPALQGIAVRLDVPPKASARSLVPGSHGR